MGTWRNRWKVALQKAYYLVFLARIPFIAVMSVLRGLQGKGKILVSPLVEFLHCISEAHTQRGSRYQADVDVDYYVNQKDLSCLT